MKKITLLLCFIAFAAMGQNPLTLEEFVNSGYSVEKTAVSQIDKSVPHENRGGSLLSFTDRAEYLTNCTNGDLLTTEDFAGGPGVLSGCDAVISAAGDLCFPAGEIVEGIEITTSGADIGNTAVYLDPSDGFGNTVPVVGSNTFTDFTIVNFTGMDDVTSFGFDLYSLTGGSNVDIRVFGAAGQIGTIAVDVTTTGPAFVGIVSDEPIMSVELEDLTQANVELIGDFVFGLCEPLALNDDPETATSLTVGEVFEDFSVIADNTEATATMIDDPSCGNFTEADLWYSFVVPASGSVSVESREDDGSITDTGLSIYEGEIGALVEVVCNDDGGTGLFSLAEVEGRTPGEVLYARVWEWNGGSLGTFQMSAYDTPPPANDDPEGAIELTVGSVFTDFPVTATNVSATDTMIDDPSCGNYGGADVWFTVTPPSTGQLVIETDTAGGITDTGMSIYTGEIGSLVEIACSDDDGNGLFSLVDLVDQDPSAPLYVRVWEWGGGGFGPFQVAAYSDCAVDGGEIALANGDTEDSICINGGGDAVDATLAGNLGTNSQWVITDTDAIIVDLPTPPPFDLTTLGAGDFLLWHLSFEDGLMGAEIGSSAADLMGCFDLSNPIALELVSEGGVCETCEYTLEMNDSFGDGWNGAIMDVLVDGVVVLDDVTLEDDPNNDGAQGVLSFPVNTGAEVTTVFGDGGGFPGEVSYRIIDTNGIEVGAGNVDMNIEPGTIEADCPSCIAPSNLAVTNIIESVSVDVSWDAVDNAVGYNWEIQDVGVPQGDPGAIASGNTTATAETVMGAFLPNQSYTLYVQTDCDAGDLSVFVSVDFMVPPTPPANNDCEDAIALECATTVTGSTAAATDSGGSAAPDVFYTYTGSGVEEIVTLSLCDGATDYDSRLRVFDDGCNLVSEIIQNDDFCGLQSEVMFTSDGTTTYTVMVEGFAAGSSGNYSLAVSCEEVLSVQDNTIEGFTFFPNPAENVLNINAQREVQNITMFNLVGQKVMEVDMNATSSTLDVSGLSKGTYVMQVISNGQTGTFKVIKK